MRRLSSLALASLLAIGTPIAAQAAPRTPERQSDVQVALDALVTAGAPGALVRVQDGAKSWTATSGVATIDSAAPVLPQSRFRAASLTKAMVSTVILQLVHDGKVTLDQPIGKWLPGVVAGADQITVR